MEYSRLTAGNFLEFVCNTITNQVARQGMSAMIRFAIASRIFTFAICFCKARYSVFRYRSWSFITTKTCSILARNEGFLCLCLLICALERAGLPLFYMGRRLILCRIFFLAVFFSSGRLSQEISIRYGSSDQKYSSKQ